MSNTIVPSFDKAAVSRAEAVSDKNAGTLPAPVTAKKKQKSTLQTVSSFANNIPGPKKLLIGGATLLAGATYLLASGKGRSAFQSVQANLPGLPEVPSLDVAQFFAPSPAVRPSASLLAKRHALLARGTEWFTQAVDGSTLASLGAYFGFSQAEMQAANPGVTAGVLPNGERIALPGEPRLHDPN